jgi:hypothetical protein
MSFRQAVVSMTLAFTTISIGGSNLAAQLPSRGPSLPVPITGVADLGGTFNGMLLIDRFAPQADGVTAVGTMTGALIANGTIRNLVLQVALPLDIAASRARLNTDTALAQASCDVLHVELGSASINVLGSTIGLAPVAFDISSTLQAGGAAAAVSTAAQSATRAQSATPAQPSTPAQASTPAQTAATTAQPGMVTASPSANTTQPGVAAQSTGAAQSTAGPATTSAQQPAAQASLGSLLCSVDRFRSVGSPAQLAQQLNGILMALGSTEGSQ